VPAIVGICIVILLILTMYVRADRENRAKGNITWIDVVLMFSITATCLQHLGVLSAMHVTWRSPLKDILRVMMVVNFDIGILKFGCFAQMSALAQYGGAIACAAVVVIVVCCVHAAVSLLWHRQSVLERFPVLFSTLGIMCFLFFTSIVSQGIVPVVCSMNPNGRQTVTRFSTVLCWEGGEHSVMLAVGLASLTVPLLFVTLCCYVVFKFPEYMREGRANIVNLFSFLFFRCRPCAYWFGLFMTFRNLIIALAPMIPSTLAQLAIVMVVFIANIIAVSYFQPWRTATSNFVDAALSVLMILTVTVGALLYQDNNTDSVTTFGMVIVCLILVILPSAVIIRVVVYASNMRDRVYQYFISHHKAGSGAFARLLKLVMIENGVDGTSVFLDSDYLQNLQNLFEIISDQTHTVIALLTHEMLQRTWCLGELVISLTCSRSCSSVAGHARIGSDCS